MSGQTLFSPVLATECSVMALAVLLAEIVSGRSVELADVSRQRAQMQRDLATLPEGMESAPGSGVLSRVDAMMP